MARRLLTKLVTMNSALSVVVPRMNGWAVGWIALALLSWHDAAHAFELVVSGAVVRAPNRVANEVFATLSVPLDEWFAPTRALSRLSRRGGVLTQAWNTTETLESQAR